MFVRRTPEGKSQPNKFTLLELMTYALVYTLATFSALLAHDVRTEVFSALAVRGFHDGAAQLALSGHGTAIHVPVHRHEPRQNPFVLGVVVFLVAVNARALNTH
jgi:hypothetical protein